MSSLRLVLVGKTGSGKSSAGNTILGEKEFKACVHFNAVTTQCQKREAIVNGRTVTVVDTPGVADLHVSVEKANDRVAECFPMSAPGPHAFLLVIKLGRFTPEEKQAADVIREVFGEAALKHTIVLFTHGDEQEDPDDIKTLLLGCGELTRLLDEVNWRYHVFNNKVEDRTQVIELLKKIDKMVGERGRHYTSELFQKAEEKRKEEQEKERLRKEEEKLKEVWKKKPEMRILLFGNTTESNRTAREIILKERCQYSGTDGCQKTNGEVLSRRVSVVETVGLSDMRRMKSEKATMQEILLCVSYTSPGPHAFVIVERSQEDSAEREDILKLIKDVFGDQALKYVMLLAIENGERHVSKAPHKHKHLPTHIFDGSRNLKQITSLLEQIDKMVDTNGGSFFTCQMYFDAEKAIKTALDKFREERMLEIIQTEHNLERKKEDINIRKYAEKENSFVSTYKVPIIMAGVGALLGGTIGALAGSTGGTVVGGPAGAAVGGAAGAVVGGKKGAAAEAAIGAGIAGAVGVITKGLISKQTEKNEKKQK